MATCGPAGTPTLEDIEGEELEQKIAVARQLSEADSVDEVSVFQEWYLEAVDEYRNKPLEKPEQFDEGARIQIGVITGEEEETPLTEWEGVVQEASEEELIVQVEDVGQTRRIDLCDLTASEPDSEDVKHDVARLAIKSPPWESEYQKLTAGLISPMFYSDHDWVQKGPFQYPPMEFYEAG